MEKSGGISKEPPSKVHVKKEILNNEIKEFAETAMNELLGWYGYSNHQREDRNSYRPNSGSNSSNPESPKSNECCGWCGKIVDETTALSSATAVFCSELCFSQSRRANFKKNKTCDWCRHVRHTVTYVESQDGSTQLQFCSDKCLNQYKMHIFWRETRAHLEIHPHLHSGGGNGGGEESSSSGTLITPELWMNKCKSPEIQQAPSPPVSPKLERHKQNSPLPLITVTPVSKLMSLPTESSEQQQQKRAKLQKKNKKKTPPIVVEDSPKFCNEMPQDLRVRPTTPPATTTTTTTVTESTSTTTTTTTKELPTTNSRLFPDYLNSSDENGGYRKFLANYLPPPTILLPYPIVLPLPIPIPLPIPLPVPNSLFESFNKTKIEASSQTDVVVDSIESRKLSNSSQNNKKIVRKRRKLMEKKSKFTVKNRKTQSH